MYIIHELLFVEDKSWGPHVQTIRELLFVEDDWTTVRLHFVTNSIAQPSSKAARHVLKFRALVSLLAGLALLWHKQAVNRQPAGTASARLHSFSNTSDL